MKAALPHTLVLVLAEPAAVGRLVHAVLLEPMPGDPIRVVPLDEHAPHAIEEHLLQARLRRRHNRVLADANRQLGTRLDVLPRLPPGVEQVIDALPTPVLLADEAGRLAHRNPTARQLAERAVDLAQALPFADAQQVGTLIEAKGTIVRLRAPDGRTFDAFSTPVPQRGGRATSLVILTDVTELVRAEEARAREAEMHATVLSAQSELGIGILVIGGDRVSYVNDAALRISGLKREEVTVAATFALVVEEERAAVRARYERRRAGSPEPDVYETRLRTPDGRDVQVELSAKRIPGRDASVILLRDVTAARTMARDLEEARLAVAQLDKLASMGSLVGGLAHEVRTPLTAIQNAAYLLARSLERRGEAREREHLVEIEASVQRIDRLVRDMRGFMRGEAPVKRLVRLDAPVAQAVRLFSATARSTVRVETDLSSASLVHADVAQVQQIVINLLQNASEAMGGQGAIRVRTRDGPEGVVLVVEDEGPGVSQEVRDRIFEAFVTTKPGGTGLGLAIVRRLAELHGARVEVAQGAAGRGARFCVTFPTAAPA